MNTTYRLYLAYITFTCTVNTDIGFTCPCSSACFSEYSDKFVQSLNSKKESFEHRRDKLEPEVLDAFKEVCMCIDSFDSCLRAFVLGHNHECVCVYKLCFWWLCKGDKVFVIAHSHASRQAGRCQAQRKLARGG